MSEFYPTPSDDTDDKKAVKKGKNQPPIAVPPTRAHESWMGQAIVQPKAEAAPISLRQALGSEAKKTPDNQEPPADSKAEPVRSAEHTSDDEIHNGELTPDEARAAALQLIAEHLAALAPQGAEAAAHPEEMPVDPAAPLSPEAAAAAATAQLLDGAEQLVGDGMPPIDAIDSAAQELIGETPIASSSLPENQASELPLQGEIPLGNPGEVAEDIILNGANGSNGGGRRGTASGAPGGSMPGGSGGGYFSNNPNGFQGAGGTPNVLNTPIVPNAPRAAQPNQSRTLFNGLLPGAAAGFIAGNILGRRAGQHQNEKENARVQQGLERHIQRIEDHLIRRETEVQAHAAHEALAAQIAPKRPEQPAVREQHVVPPPAQETTGTEAVNQPPTSERPATRPTAEITKPTARVQVERLERKDLLHIAEEVTIDAVNIREVYEANLIDEDGVRHIVAAHLRGENIRPILKQELNIHEGRHERYPHDHHHGAVGGTPKVAITDDTSAVTDTPTATIQPTVVSPTLPPIKPPTVPSPAPADPGMLIVANIAAFIILGVLVAIFAVIWIMR